MLKEQYISDNGIIIRDKVKMAIDRIKFAYEVSQNRGMGALYVAFSGGKDSTVLAELVKLSGVPYELHYNITGVDPPEVIYFMRKNYSELHWDKYKKSMFRLIIENHIPPTQLIRYCCLNLKERGGEGKICLTGVRAAESVKRSKRKPFEKVVLKEREKFLFNDNDGDRRLWESCVKKGKDVVNPIIDWTESDVWEFIKSRNIPYCKLYDEGFKRIGCIGCPMATTKERLKEFARYPKYKQNYIMTFEKMLKNMTRPSNWKTGEEVFDWWIKDKSKNSPIKGQTEMSFEKEKEDDKQ